MALSPQTINIVKATAPVVGAHAEQITTTFYNTMFKNNPEVLAFFNKSHQKHKAQPRALADAVVSFATHIEELDTLGPLVARMAHRHVALSVKPEMYSIVHSNMMLAIGETLGDAVTPEIGQGWSDAVMALAQICIDAEEDLYKKNEARQGGWRYEREFTVSKRTDIAQDVAQFDFAAADGYDGPFEFTPGQYLTLRLPRLGCAPRHYTVTSAPGDSTLQIAVRKVDGGEESQFLHSDVQAGEKVLLGAPAGVFTPVSDANYAALVSAGIGITPMVSFLKHMGPDRVKAALHFDETKERHAFRELFEASGVDSTCVYSGAGVIPSAEEMKQRANEVVAKAGPDADIYVCGPLGFMETMVANLKGAGASSVHYEIFGTGTLQTNHEE